MLGRHKLTGNSRRLEEDVCSRMITASAKYPLQVIFALIENSRISISVVTSRNIRSVWQRAILPFRSKKQKYTEVVQEAITSLFHHP